MNPEEFRETVKGWLETTFSKDGFCDGSLLEKLLERLEQQSHSTEDDATPVMSPGAGGQQGGSVEISSEAPVVRVEGDTNGEPGEADGTFLREPSPVAGDNLQTQHGDGIVPSSNGVSFCWEDYYGQ